LNKSKPEEELVMTSTNSQSEKRKSRDEIELAKIVE
jgi:hypothetical protein